eukprot:6860451-Lingulodinium_polyedra.AAC.1
MLTPWGSNRRAENKYSRPPKRVASMEQWRTPCAWAANASLAACEYRAKLPKVHFLALSLAKLRRPVRFNKRITLSACAPE